MPKTALSPRKPSRLTLVALLVLLACGLTVAATSWARPATPASPFALLAGGKTPFGSETAATLGARVLEHVASRLELTDAQRDEIRALAADHGPEIVVAMRRIQQSRVGLFESIHEHPSRATEIRDASAKLAAAQTDLALLRADLSDDLHDVLTPAQQDELDEMKQNLRTLLEMAADGFTDRLAERLSA